MTRFGASLLEEPEVRTAFKQAWEDSNPGFTGGHEEGGFILLSPEGQLSVVRWPKGDSDAIVLPDYADCKIGHNVIVGTFHTHPNTGPDYLQEPGDTDIRAVADDPDLKGRLYAGEFVISERTIYLIRPDGRVQEVALADEVIRSE